MEIWPGVESYVDLSLVLVLMSKSFSQHPYFQIDPESDGQVARAFVHQIN